MGPRHTKHDGFTQEKVAYQIHELLDLPTDNHGEPSIGHRIIRTIKTTIRDALQRGESVSIPGFGIFRVVTRQPRKTGSNYIAQGITAPIAILNPAKRIVTFTPSEQLIAMLNHHNEDQNWDEKRATEKWNR